MALVKVKPTSPGRRGVVKVVHPELHKGRPFAGLVENKKKHAGRNHHGHITVRHQGGGHKQAYRLIDFCAIKMAFQPKWSVWNTTPTARRILLCFVMLMANAATLLQTKG